MEFDCSKMDILRIGIRILSALKRWESITGNCFSYLHRANGNYERREKNKKLFNNMIEKYK